MKAFAVLLVLGGAGLLAKEPDAAALAGVYRGQVDGGKALIVLKADGTALVKPPDAGEDDRVRGTWKQEKPGLVLRIDAPDNPGEKVVVRFRIEAGVLMLVNVIESNGEEKTFAPPRFKQAKAGNKKFTGEYKGLFEEKPMHLVVLEDGKVQVWPDVPNVFEPLYHGTWKAADGLTVCKVQTDGGNAEFHLRPSEKDYLLVQVEKPGGEVKKFGAPRFRRVNQAAVVPKPLNAATRKLAGKYVGKVKNKQAVLELRADGTAAAWPQTENQNRVLRGTWSLKEGKITAKLKSGDDTQTGTLLLAVDGADLILKKIIDPDGGTKEPNVHFRRQK
ncbi:MAG: hypothetical protein QF600_09340 [Verrucomicrobiota bacterium]|jgi:hypothetical protein|nr:hypothetical protein [Verrucomicrobiota bacterium]